MGVFPVRIIDQGPLFFAYPLNKVKRSLLPRVREEKQFRGARAGDRDRIFSRLRWKFVHHNVEKIRQIGKDLFQFLGSRLPIRQLGTTGDVLVDGISDSQCRRTDVVFHDVLDRTGLEPIRRACGDADDENDDQRHLDLKAESRPPVQHGLW